MVVVKSLAFLSSFCGVSIICGYIFYFREEQVKLEDLFLYGMISSFGIFEILAIPFSIKNWPLSQLCLIYFLLIGGAGGAKFILETRKGKTSIVHCVKIKAWRIEKITAVLIIMFQVIAVVFLWHEDLDDATYVGISTVSYFTNTVNQYSPSTGELMSLSVSGEYILSAFPVLWAMWARIFTIHPAILVHTILPVILIPTSYLVYGLIGTELFGEDKKKDILIAFVGIINLFGGFSSRTTSSFLLFRIWQGKAVLCNIIIPLFYYYFIKGRTGKKDLTWYIGIYAIVFAGELASFSAVMLLPILIGIVTAVDILNRESWKKCILFVGSCVSCIVLGIIYIGLRGL